MSLENVKYNDRIRLVMNMFIARETISTCWDGLASYKQAHDKSYPVIVWLYCTFSNDMTRHASTSQTGMFYKSLEPIEDVTSLARRSRGPVSDIACSKSATSLWRRGQELIPWQDREEVNNMSATSHVVSCRVAVLWIGLKQAKLIKWTRTWSAYALKAPLKLGHCRYV